MMKFYSVECHLMTAISDIHSGFLWTNPQEKIHGKINKLMSLTMVSFFPRCLVILPDLSWIFPVFGWLFRRVSYFNSNVLVPSAEIMSPLYSYSVFPCACALQRLHYSFQHQQHIMSSCSADYEILSSPSKSLWVTDWQDKASYPVWSPIYGLYDICNAKGMLRDKIKHQILWGAEVMKALLLQLCLVMFWFLKESKDRSTRLLFPDAHFNITGWDNVMRPLFLCQAWSKAEVETRRMEGRHAMLF